MKRLELFEFEDYDWLPRSIRTGATNLIIVFHKLLGTADVLSKYILQIRESCNFDQVVDLGSGSGGAMLECFDQINHDNKDQPLKLMLTDLHPNPNIVNKINNSNLSHIEYNPLSVNATDINDAPAGLKTMIASFHHMRPEIAEKILNSAENNNEPIFIYELAKNNVPTILWWILLPISLVILFVMSLVMTPFVRPLTFKQFFFTYIIPVIPIVYAWDGQASLMRTYTFDDIKELLNDKANPNYKWDIGDAINSNGKKKGYFVIGTPMIY